MCFGGRLKRCLFRRRAFRRPLEWFDLERLSVRDALGGKPGGNDAFEQELLARRLASVQSGTGGFA